jgi:hypothetical protein
VARQGHSTRRPPNLFGPAPLLDGEDTAHYDELHARVRAAIWCATPIDLTWEVLRLRRLKVALFNANADGDSDEDASNPRTSILWIAST